VANTIKFLEPLAHIGESVAPRRQEGGGKASAVVCYFQGEISFGQVEPD
jgi:hypothetical protein